MNKSLCQREEEVVAAVISGQMDTSILEHLNGCDSCRAAADLTRLFQDEKADVLEEIIDTREADLIWMKAAYAVHRKQRRTRRLGQAVGVISGILVAALTGLVISPDVSLSFDQIRSLSSLSLLPLVPIVLMFVLAVSLVNFANRANGSTVQ